MWKNATSQTIKNCFRKCSFSQTASSRNEPDFESIWEFFNDEDWHKMFMEKGINFEDYYIIDHPSKIIDCVM